VFIHCSSPGWSPNRELSPSTGHIGIPTMGRSSILANHLDLRPTGGFMGCEQEVPMNIGEAAKASGINAKMLRHYEGIGLFPHPGRTQAGYRTYSQDDVETLRFIRRARDFGLPMDRIKMLVGLWQDKSRPSREVKDIATRQVAELDARIGELTAMRDALAALAKACHGDNRPDCPILSDLAGTSSTPLHPSPSLRNRMIGQRLAGNS